MRTALLVCCIILMASAPGFTFTLTFDDQPLGLPPAYDGVGFGGGWSVADHSTSTWGPPHSGKNVLVCNWDRVPFWPMIKFGYYSPETSTVDYYSIRSLGAYFSTEPGVVVRMSGYHDTDENLISSVLIGSPDQAWTNQYVQLASQAGEINYIMLDAVSSDDALLHFCTDDMTITPVPEPSSLAALGIGLLPLAGVAIRRRRA